MTDYNTSRRAYALALVASLILATLPAATFAQTESTGIVDSVETSETALAQEDVDSYEPGMTRDDDTVIREFASGCDACCDCCSDDEVETLLGGCGEQCIEGLFDSVLGWKNDYDIPISVGAWHWFATDLSGSNSGYGTEGLRGTYWWYVTADPEVDLGNGRKIGGHLEYRLRDGDNFRSFFDSRFWSYEAYGYIHDDDLGTLKAGQIWKRFGLDWDGVFFGNIAYFDGFKLDPDYGLSWEKTTDMGGGLSVDTFAQFFFHEDGVNGSFGGADAESVPGIHERNTGVVRVLPTWTYCDDSTFALGLSALAGQIDSERADVSDQNVAAWAVDATYTKDRWKLFGEMLQSYGTLNPARYVSGGPSNRITDFLVGAHYTTGPVVYRASYSLGLDSNPYADHNLVVAGATVKLTEHVELYIEYVNEKVHNNATAGRIEFFDSMNFIIHWNY